jgi:hypothetical protein
VYTKFVQNPLDYIPFLIVVTDHLSVIMNEFKRNKNIECYSQYTTVMIDLTFIVRDSLD